MRHFSVTNAPLAAAVGRLYFGMDGGAGASAAQEQEQVRPRGAVADLRASLEAAGAMLGPGSPHSAAVPPESLSHAAAHEALNATPSLLAAIALAKEEAEALTVPDHGYADEDAAACLPPPAAAPQLPPDAPALERRFAAAEAAY